MASSIMSVADYDSVVCDRGLIISLDYIKHRFPDIKRYNKFLKVFTVKENIKCKRNVKFCRELILKAYQIVDNYLILPRVKLTSLTKVGILKNTTYITSYEPAKIESDLTLTCDLYDYQTACIDHLLTEHLLPKDKGIAYFKLDTGLGKTITAIGLLSRLRVKTLVIVPSSKDLQGQWIDALSAAVPHAKSLAYNNRMRDSCLDGVDVVVAVVNTFCKKSVEFLQKGKFGLVILDEAHEFCSRVFGKTLWLIQGIQYILGLSATPHAREDELDYYVDQFLGAPIDADTIVNVSKERFQGKVTRIDYCGHPDYCDIVLNQNGDTNNALTLRKVVSDPQRIELIVQSIRELYDDPAEHGIFVFAEHRDYLVLLRDKVMREFGEDSVLEDYDTLTTTSDIDIQILRGGASKSLVHHVRKQGARIVLTTYGYSRRGIDLPNMTAMILVTPRRSGLMQILGRITRKRSDITKVRHVIDLVDYSTIYRNQYYSRKSVYDSKGWPVSRRAVEAEVAG
jgi:superfamily II DNA or RNA helicase